MIPKGKFTLGFTNKLGRCQHIECIDLDLYSCFWQNKPLDFYIKNESHVVLSKTLSLWTHWAFLYQIPSKEKGQRSGIGTIKNRTWPRIPHGKVTKIQFKTTNESQKVSHFPSEPRSLWFVVIVTEPRHEIYKNVVYTTSKASDQSSHTHSLIRAFASRLDIIKLLNEHHLEFLSLKGGCTGSSEYTHFKMLHSWKSRVTAHNERWLYGLLH